MGKTKKAPEMNSQNPEGPEMLTRDRLICEQVRRSAAEGDVPNTFGIVEGQRQGISGVNNNRCTTDFVRSHQTLSQKLQRVKMLHGLFRRINFIPVQIYTRAFQSDGYITLGTFCRFGCVVDISGFN